MNDKTLTHTQKPEHYNPKQNDYSSRLPINFVKHDSIKVTYRKTKTSGFWRLPFIAKPRTKTATKFWDLPASGGYFGGYETGEAMAQALLKIMRERTTNSFHTELASIVESLMVRFEQEGGSNMANKEPMTEWSPSFDSFRGQYIGFFNTLCQWLELAAVHMGRSLDTITEQDISIRASMGLSFDQKSYMDSLSEK